MRIMAPTNEEYTAVLQYLKQLFRPDNAGQFYESGYPNLNKLRESLAKPYEDTYHLCEAIGADLSHPLFPLLKVRLPMLTFPEACNYLLFYLRLPTRQAGDQTFFGFWKDGTAAALVQRMLDTMDRTPAPEEKAEPYLCPQCDQIIFPEYRFCPNCGLDLQKRYCLRCTREIPEDASYCPFCGEKQGTGYGF